MKRGSMAGVTLEWIAKNIEESIGELEKVLGCLRHTQQIIQWGWLNESAATDVQLKAPPASDTGKPT
jgi:hypothetical protein